MILGIGIDILKKSRIKLEHARRVLSEDELIVFNGFNNEGRKIEYLAGRFSVKEAIIKAIGSTNYKIGMRDITIINDDLGRPIILKPSYSDMRFLISLSHEEDNCVGMCVIEKV